MIGVEKKERASESMRIDREWNENGAQTGHA
jgi:hypothetical protein